MWVSFIFSDPYLAAYLLLTRSSDMWLWPQSLFKFAGLFDKNIFTEVRRGFFCLVLQPPANDYEYVNSDASAQVEGDYDEIETGGN